MSRALQPSEAPAEPARKDNFHDLEGNICDATAITGILSDIVEGLITNDRPPSMQSFVYLPKENEDRLSYAAHEASAQLLALKDRFYGIYDSERNTKRGQTEPVDDALDIGRKAACWLPFDPVLFLTIALQCRAPVTLAPQAVSFHEPEAPSDAYEFIRGWRNATLGATEAISKALRRRATMRDAHLQLVKSIDRASRRAAKGGDE